MANLQPHDCRLAEIQKNDSSITLYKIKNEIRRNLGNYIEHVGTKKNRGILLKK